MHAPRTVYLAGPILGCTGPEANHWRRDVAAILKTHNITGVSPLRCEPLIGDKYEGTYDSDPRFGTAKAIASKNLFDVKNCDITIAYLPKPPEGRTQSYGTLCEVVWAYAFGKPAIIVSDDPKIMSHPCIAVCAAWMVPTMEQAIDICIGILGGYNGGKNV